MSTTAVFYSMYLVGTSGVALRVGIVGGQAGKDNRLP